MHIIRALLLSAPLLAAALLGGCASNEPATPDPDGITYHRDKDLQKVWLADQFDFQGYDTLYVGETKLDAKPHNEEEVKLLEWARPFLRDQLAAYIRKTDVFRAVVTSESGIKPGSKTLRLENTIIEYEKGGGGARYFVGIYGGGQPVIRVRGIMSDGARAVFRFEARRSGESAGARVIGAFKSDQDIQTEDINDLGIDTASFISDTAKHIPRK
jgi:hypothetical protein